MAMNEKQVKSAIEGVTRDARKLKLSPEFLAGIDRKWAAAFGKKSEESKDD